MMLKRIATVLAAVAVAFAGVLYFDLNDVQALIGIGVNAYRTMGAPAGTLTVERAAGIDPSPLLQVPASSASALSVAAGEWPGFNRTLTSERFSPLDQINVHSVSRLRVQCTYDIGQKSSFETGPIMLNGALIGTTDQDMFSIDPQTCRQNWRVHEGYTTQAKLTVNRGTAYLDGKLFRGTQDGRVIAYSFATGQRLWQTTIANQATNESVPAAPIAWNGMVFIGNAGGDYKGNKGRMYALDANSGRILWEFYLVPRSPGDVKRGPQGASPLDSGTWHNGLHTPITGGATWTSYTLDPQTGELYVPGGNPAPDFAPGLRPGDDLYTGSIVVLDARTGAYKRHFQLVPKDWHDWDISAAPSLIHSRGGKRLLIEAPKDGILYGIDLASNAVLYRTPVNRMVQEKTAFSVGKPVHFCPGSSGGAEWNGPSYDPDTNLVTIGQVDWCTTVTLDSADNINGVALTQVWAGNAYFNPYDMLGKQDSSRDWGGWLYAVDADSGAWRWRAHSNYPILGGSTPTAGGLVFFGDTGGNFYALNAANGARLWSHAMDGAIGGGVISFLTHGRQRIAVAAGMTSIVWPTKRANARIVVYGLADGTNDNPTTPK